MRCAPCICSSNYKGGVGKTTTSRVLAQGLTGIPEFHQGKPVLIVDLDPQGNTSKRWQLLQTLGDGSQMPKPHPDLLDTEPNHSSVCDLWLDLLHNQEPLVPEPYPTSNPLIMVVPAFEDRMYEAMQVPKADLPKLGIALRNWLRAPEIAERFCCVILDTQPSKSPLIDAALMAATHVYIPFIPEPQPVEGVYSIISYVYAQSQKRGTDVPLNILGLLPNMVRRTRLHSTHLKKLRDHPAFGRYVMPVKLDQRTAYAETDDWRNTPDQVTDIAGTSIEIEAKKFARYIVKQIAPDVKLQGGR